MATGGTLGMMTGPSPTVSTPGAQVPGQQLPIDVAMLLEMLQRQQDSPRIGYGTPGATEGRPLFGPSGTNPLSGALTGFIDKRMPGYAARTRDAYNVADSAARTNDVRAGYAARSFPGNPNLAAAFMQDPSVSNPTSPNYDPNLAAGQTFAASVAANRGGGDARSSLMDELLNQILEQMNNPAMGTGQ